MIRRMQILIAKTSPAGGSAGRVDSERGAALVLVLWFTVVISLVAAAVARLGQSDLKVALNLAGASQAEALADGGIYLAAAAVSRYQAADPWPIDGRTREIALGSGRLLIRVRDEATKLNPNSATAAELERLFANSGIETPRAAELATVLVNVRDAIGRGAPVGDVRSTMDRNSPFLTLDDVGRVAGMTVQEFALVRDRLSLFIASGIGAQLAARNQPNALPQPEVVPGNRGLAAQPRSRADLYEITAVAETVNGARAERHAVLRISPAGGGRIQILSWD